jgi:hypothetical protein
MPRYDFDRYEGPRFVPNDEGRALDDPDATERKSAELAAQIGWDHLPKRDDRKVTTEVRKERGQRVLTETVSMHIDRVEPPSEATDGLTPLETSLAGVLAAAKLLT